jgi:hypothetical protein
MTSNCSAYHTSPESDGNTQAFANEADINMTQGIGI